MKSIGGIRPHFLVNLCASAPFAAVGIVVACETQIPVDTRLCCSGKEQAKTRAVPESYTPENKFKMECHMQPGCFLGRSMACQPIAVVLAILLLNSLTPAQNSKTFSGIVLDVAGAAIAYATVELQIGGHLRETHTDSDGRFALSIPLKPESTTGVLIVSARGFAAKRIELTFAEPYELEVHLQPAPIIERIQIKADDYGNSINSETLDHAEIANSPSLAIDDTLRQVPGFSLFRRSGSLTANPTSQGVSLRGVGANGASRASVFIDGIPLNSPFGGWIYWQRLPRTAIQSIGVINGPASDSYGSGALGGVINIETRRIEQPFFETDLSVGNDATAAASVVGGMLIRNFGITASAQLLRTDGYISVARESRGVFDTPARTADLSGYITVSRQLQNHGHLFVRANSFGESRKNGTPLQINDTRIWSLDFGFDKRLDTYGDFSARSYGSREIFNQSFSAVSADRNSESLTNRQRNPSQQLGFALQWQRVFAAHHAIVAGLEGRNIRGHSAETTFTVSRTTARLDVGGRQMTFAAFAQDTVHARQWTISFGGRVDRWTNRGFANRVPVSGPATFADFPGRVESAFSPRVSVARSVGPDILVTASVYRAFRTPTLNELYRSFRVGNVLTNANADLRAERLTGGEAGFAFHTFGERLMTRANFFWSQISDPIANVTMSSTTGLITRQRQNLGTVRARGIEADASYKIVDSLSFAAQYLLTDTTVRRFPANPALEGLLVPQIPRHQFSFQLTFSRARWLASVQGRSTSTQFDDDQNLLPLHPFFTVDAEVSLKLSRQFEIYFAAQNLTGVRYDIGRTPVLTTGPPVLGRLGCRVTLR